MVLTRVTSMVTTRALLTIKGLLAAPRRQCHGYADRRAQRVREIFDCGGTLYSMDATRISNLDKARENARAFAAEVRRLLPTQVIRSNERGASCASSKTLPEPPPVPPGQRIERAARPRVWRLLFSSVLMTSGSAAVGQRHHVSR